MRAVHLFEKLTKTDNPKPFDFYDELKPLTNLDFDATLLTTEVVLSYYAITKSYSYSFTTNL